MQGACLPRDAFPLAVKGSGAQTSAGEGRSFHVWPTWNGYSQDTAHCPRLTTEPHVRDRRDRTVGAANKKNLYCFEAVGTVEHGATRFHLGSLS